MGIFVIFQFFRIVNMIMDGFILPMCVDVRMDMLMDMAVNQFSMPVFMGMDVDMFMGML